MNGFDLAAIRKSFGLNSAELARSLGCHSVSVRRLEARHNDPIPEPLARLVRMYNDHGIPKWAVQRATTTTKE